MFVLSPECDPYNPATVRRQWDRCFRKDVRCSPREFTDWAKLNRVTVVASSPVGLMDYKVLRYRFPAVLVIGSEKRGCLNGRKFEGAGEPIIFTNEMVLVDGIEAKSRTINRVRIPVPILKIAQERIA